MDVELGYIRRVLALFAKADIHGDLFWQPDGSFFANVSDVFAWGGADLEAITSERLPLLEQAYADLKEVGHEEYTVELYAARIRGMRPQGAAYPKTRRAQALFDACGPEREIGLGNPRPQPEPGAD